MSIFSEALRELLDDTDIFSRKEWAEVLGVKESDIDSWVADLTVPRTYNLDMLVTVVLEYMKRPVFSELSSILAKMSSEEQEEYLESKYPAPIV